jgi:AGCS family alanine or glycine:cation symporter
MCTILLVIVTGVWKLNTDSSLLVQEALSHYFPYMDYFMPLCLFILGYSTITAYFVAGIKCADFIWPSYGKKLYMIYGFCAFIIFSFIETRYAFAIMSTAGGLLMVINLAGIMKLRKDIVYKV